MNDTIPTLAGIDLLGYGYDILGKYADMEYRTIPLISIASDRTTYTWPGDDECVYAIPTTTTCSAASSQVHGTETAGETYQEYTSKMTTAFGASGSYGAFAGSIDASFSSEVRTSNSYYYETILDTFSACELELNASAWVLDAEVQAELEGSGALTPRALFEKYGTHVVVGVIVGGECRLSMYGSKSEFESVDSFSVNASATYGAVSGNASFEQESASRTESVSTSTDLLVLGGTEAAAAALQSAARSSGITESSAYTEWADSIKQNPSILGFANGHLQPLWSFCTDTQRQRTLEAEFERLYTPLRYASQWEDGGDVGSAKLYGYYADALFTADDDDPREWFVVGLGINIETTGELNRVALCFENIRSGERRWVSGGVLMVSQPEGYERIGTVPEGSALVGLAVHAEGDDVEHLALYYQRINRGHSDRADEASLDSTIGEVYVGKQHSGWDYDGKPASSLGTVLGGLSIGITNNKQVWVQYWRSEFYLASTRPYTLACGSVTAKDYGSVSKVNLRSVSATSFAGDESNLFVVVGFGGTINDSGNLDRSAVCFANVRTGERTWYNSEGKRITDLGGYERIGAVPEGHALTGLALHAQSGKLEHLKLYYQKIKKTDDLTGVGDTGVWPSVGTMFVGGSHSGWDGEQIASTGTVLNGLAVGVKDNKHVGFRFYETVLAAVED